MQFIYSANVTVEDSANKIDVTAAEKVLNDAPEPAEPLDVDPSGE